MRYAVVVRHPHAAFVNQNSECKIKKKSAILGVYSVHIPLDGFMCCIRYRNSKMVSHTSLLSVLSVVLNCTQYLNQEFLFKLLKHCAQSSLSLVLVHLPLLHFPTTSPLPAVLFLVCVCCHRANLLSSSLANIIFRTLTNIMQFTRRKRARTI